MNARSADGKTPAKGGFFFTSPSSLAYVSINDENIYK